MSKTELRRHQLTLLEMLKEIDRICKKHDIKYMLFAGSCLGAVRHKGFIPWDDDLDIVMPRDDYERFLDIAVNEIDVESYFVQREFSEHWPMFFSKLRKNNTAYLEKMILRDNEQHQGIYVDIFPCDNLAPSSFKQKLQFYASKIVVAKSLDKRGYLTDSIKKKIFILCCRLLPHKLFHRFVQGRKYKDSLRVHTFLGASSKFEKSVYPREWFEKTTDMQFEDGVFPVPEHYDELLSVLYGDYMTPPPEDQREVKVHAMKIDLDKSYTEYIGWQSQQTIDTYSRSIR